MRIDYKSLNLNPQRERSIREIKNRLKARFLDIQILNPDCKSVRKLNIRAYCCKCFKYIEFTYLRFYRFNLNNRLKHLCPYEYRGGSGNVFVTNKVNEILIKYGIDNKDIAYYRQTLKTRHKDMLKRCFNPKDKAFKFYQNIEGDKVCKEWLDIYEGYLNFVEWAMQNGFNPKKRLISLDRLDSKKGYAPDNCQWIAILDNSVKNIQYYKEAKIFLYEDCGLFLTLKQRARWLGIQSVSNSKSKKYRDLNKYANGVWRVKEPKVMSYYYTLSKINEKEVINGRVKYLGIYKMHREPLTYDEMAELVRKTEL